MSKSSLGKYSMTQVHYAFYYKHHIFLTKAVSMSLSNLSNVKMKFRLVFPF